MEAMELRAWRKAQGLTQAQAAELLGVAEVTLGKYERGDRPVPEKIVSYVRVKGVRAEESASPPLAEPESPKLSICSEGLRPYPRSNMQFGASASWDARTPKPGWKRVDGCCRIVKDTIPDPIPFYAPSWAGERGVPTADGRVFDYETGHQMRDLAQGGEASRPDYGSRLKVTTKKGR